MKIVVFLGDGMADEPNAVFNGKTALDVSQHPNMDALARRAGLFGLAKTVPEGMSAGSDVANLSVLGYNPALGYTGRSPLEAVSMGIDLEEDDVTYRCNFVTLSRADKLEETTMLDYSAGEISTAEAHELIASLQGIVGEGLSLVAGVSYRNCLVLPHAQTGAKLTPPHDITGKPVHDCLPSGQNGALLLDLMEKAYARLADHPVNQKRRALGQNEANAIWFWGEGTKPKLANFYETFGLRGAVISAVDLMKGIGKCIGLRVLEVEGATGTYHTNFKGKAEAAMAALQSGCDYVYIHVEAADECGHQNQPKEKVYSIEQIDAQIVGPVMDYLENSGDDWAVLLMPDHPTPLAKGTHTKDPVPFVLCRKGDAEARNVRYTETDAAATGLYIPAAHELLRLILGHL
ncbi:MAG: cofactor-independent phosphoglycerate mutase [Clostridiales bacterium]|nr:cofactor-independent phosphoglycerate mutase [Clostridiales bacterium]